MHVVVLAVSFLTMCYTLLINMFVLTCQYILIVYGLYDGIHRRMCLWGLGQWAPLFRGLHSNPINLVQKQPICKNYQFMSFQSL